MGPRQRAQRRGTRPKDVLCHAALLLVALAEIQVGNEEHVHGVAAGRNKNGLQETEVCVCVTLE